MNLMHSVSLVSYYPPPQEPLCRLTCVGTLSFRVRELPGLSASNVLAGIAGSIGDREELAREYPNSPLSPRFLSASSYSLHVSSARPNSKRKCPHIQEDSQLPAQEASQSLIIGLLQSFGFVQTRHREYANMGQGILGLKVGLEFYFKVKVLIKDKASESRENNRDIWL